MNDKVVMLPMSSKKCNMQNKKCDYKTLAIMTLYSNFTPIEMQDEKGVYVCADANMIYGFNDNLELLNGYPLTGWGYPVFADVNGDKVDDFISLTLDNKISVWNLR